jgi:hypothetical protein
MAQEQCDAPEAQGISRSHGVSQQAINYDFLESPREGLESENPVYPSGMKLVFIFVALCLTVFLVALVSIQTPNMP